ncbi:MAG TPA: tRNA pseudouridine(55) synthase, partial [Verrucomicrobiae bacterium]|nr:tRNA pseudouridine(55) synthase [Verrucomicrobiae bacterium]
MQPQLTPFDGVLLVDKPAGMTSHDVVDRVRRHFGFKKVG